MKYFGNQISFVVLCSLFLHGPIAQALSEQDLPDSIDRVLIPFFSNSTPGVVSGELGVPLEYRVFRQKNPTRGTIMIVPGYNETMAKFSEVAFDLFEEGYSVILYDHRGQGRSGRFLKDPHKASIDAFENLVKDMKIIREKVVPLVGSENILLLAHSMGGGVAARYLEEYPEDFQAAVFTAPMLKIAMNPWARAPAFWLGSVLRFLRLDDIYVLGPKDPRTSTFQENTVTQSKLRFEAFQLAASRLDSSQQTWGLTARWIYEANRGIDLALKNAAKVAVPVFILQAGKDSFVDSEGQNEYCTSAKNCKLLRIEESKHEILLETDSVRSPAMREVLSFFSLHSRSQKKGEKKPENP